uniref:F-box associated domain-containing protein n=1 Tax=Rhizophagus irregularis (strain DAOM 181602 / DAOM 197198 / MUCL 43194) TaxID=747089 RepID=U9TGQ5_RHIID
MMKLITKKLFKSCNIFELENLLINCQNLNELSFIINDLFTFNWDKLFELLTKSSPIRLYKFEFDFYEAPKLKSLKFFFDNWKGRNPMLLKFSRINNELTDLIENYKVEGIVKQYSNDSLDKNEVTLLNYNLPIETYDFTDPNIFLF